MTVIETFLISLLTTSLGFLFYILRLKFKEKSEAKAELELKKRKAFKKLLNEHSDLVFGTFQNKTTQEWLNKFSEMSRDILTWAPDAVLSEYGKYAQEYSGKGEDIIERELHFANAILAFRKSLGYKNKGKLITPEQIIYIFRCGHKNKNI